MGIKVGMCGTGEFADSFIPLFKAHPEVDEMILCDLKADRLREKSEKFGISDTCPSLDELCQTSVDAIVIITQHHIHAPQAVQALKSGKHVYSAVPCALSLDEVGELVKTVEETGKIYMVGETSYYRPSAIYCRERFRKGDFGRIIYSEAEYYHDYSHGLYPVMKNRFGKEWEKYSGSPPMHYPTHSVGLIVSVLGAHATHVSGLGVVDTHEDNLFAREDNVWKNPFSNESMLCKMSDGSIARFNEFRRIGHPGREGMRMYGTDASYEDQINSQMWVTKDLDTCIDLNEELKCVKAKGSKDRFHDISNVHPTERLPEEFKGLTNGHGGSHQFLVQEFVEACISEKQPLNNVWQAARYFVPGLVAHESAMSGGELLKVPDFGDGPA